MTLRVGTIESLAFGFECYCIQKRRWYGWSTIHRGCYKYIKEHAKHYEDNGHTVLWYI